MSTIGTTNALNSSVSALMANQQALGVISNNIANASDTNYSSEIVNESPIILGGLPQGVDLDQVTRNANNFLIQDNMSQSSTVGAASILNDYYQRIQNYYGTPDSANDTSNSGNSINDVLNNFFTAVDTLAVDPSQASSRSNAITQGVTLAQNISGLATNLENTRYQADQDIATGVTYINSQLTDLQSVNAEIRNASENDQSTAALLDQRDADLNNVAQYMDINTNYQSDGEVSVSTTSGVDLLTPNARYALSYTQAGSAQTFINNSTLAPINVYRVNSDGSLSATPSDTLVSGGVSGVTSGPNAIVSKLGSGQLAGLLQVRDTEVPELLDQVNNLASNVTNAVNAIQNNGAGFPPPSSLTGTKGVASTDQFDMSGSVMIGVTDANGNPVASPYANQPNGVPPLTLNLSTLDGGQPTMQDVMNAINNYYGSAPAEVSLGNVNNIQLNAVSDAATTGSNFTFNLGLSNYSADNSSVQVTGMTVSGGSTVVSGVPSTATNVAPGTVSDSPNMTVNFTGAGPWTVNATVQVTDTVTGTVSNDTISYVINPAASGLEGKPYNFSAISGTGNATIVNPTTVQPIAHAQIVDANGNPVAAGQEGFLQISTYNSSNGIAINELTSGVNGQVNPSNGNILAGTDTGQGFSDFFQLNDFFVRSATGTSNALNMAVSNNIQNNPNLISTGQLTAAPASTDPTAGPNYTYSLAIGNNQAIQNLANLQNQQLSFAATSGIPALNVTLSNYGGEIISYAADQVSAAAANSTEQTAIQSGLQQQIQGISGVNVDAQLALMLQFQNDYSAAAKVITTMQDIFTTLQQALT